MIINISEVLSEPHKSLDEVINPELRQVNISGRTFKIKKIDPLHLRIDFLEDKKLLIKGETKVTVVIPCDRCLEDVDTELDLSFEKNVKPGVSDPDVDDESDEANYIDGYHLDVEQLLYNEILIGWPAKVLCSEDCKGICSVCGQNLNYGSCDCEDTSLDPRMSVIRDVFKNFKEV